MTKHSVYQLRAAALRIAQEMHPDQVAELHPRAFSFGTRFTEVRMSGGSVLITRDMAIRAATEAKA